MHAESMNPIQRIVVVGGGSAGWITAGLAAAAALQRSDRQIQVTLVESPDVATIGVGEGTWPTMRTTLSRLGIAEPEFLACCAASFKQGTRFDGWVDGSDGDRYYHPFTAPAGYPSQDLASHWWAKRGRLSFVDAVSPQGMVCDRNLAPKREDMPDYAGVLNYGYHLDAGRFAGMLAEHCTTRLGVEHVQAHIDRIESHDNGDIAALSTRQSGRIEGDLFIDCSGMRALLLGEHFGIPIIDCSQILFNDSALAVQVPYAQPDSAIASQTISTAQPAGWIWDIGLQSRRGIGHVYSSAHMDDEQAGELLRQYIERTGGGLEGASSIRKITFCSGHRREFWHRNCVAIGMASGFIEPLEASALVMVELSARMIAEELPANRAIMQIVARRFNQRFTQYWSRIIDFLKLHYLLSRRDDSAYWRDNRQTGSVPAHLNELLELWRYRPPGTADFPRIDEIFSAASYQYVLYGMQFDFRHGPVHHDVESPAAIRDLFRDNVRLANRCLSALPTNRALLDRLARLPEGSAL